MTDNCKTIYHYGVPGMRWGHRKEPELVGGRVARRKIVTSNGKAPAKNAYTNAQFTRGQIKQMQEERKRLETERARLEMLKKQPGHVDEKDSMIDVDTQKKIRSGISTVNTIVSIGGQAATVYNNAKKVAEISKPFVEDAKKITNKLLDAVGNRAIPNGTIDIMID